MAEPPSTRASPSSAWSLSVIALTVSVPSHHRHRFRPCSWGHQTVAQLATPDLATVRRWLRSIEDPIVRLLIATYLDGADADRSSLIADVVHTAPIRTALEG